MNDIVEQLRHAADDTDAVKNASVAYLLEHAAGEIELLRLTDDERQAIRWIVGDDLSADGVSIQATLRGLLKRHGPTGSE